MHENRSKTKTSIALFVGVLTIAGAAWGFSHISNTYIKPQNNSESANPAPAKLPSIFSSLGDDSLKSENGRTNMLLLGISGTDYISGELTDTVIFSSVDMEQKTAAMVSIPRDLWVSHDGRFTKINELYKMGGGTEKPNAKAANIIKDKVSDITGQSIHYTAVINLDGIEEIVEALGGVETEEGRLNGEEALWYIRDRSRPGGDFGRIERQQKLLVAIAKNLTADDTLQSRSQLLDLFVVVQENISTDVPLTKAVSLYDKLGGTDTDNIDLHFITPETGLVYSGRTEVGGINLYTLHPAAGKEDYSEIRDFVTKILD